MKDNTRIKTKHNYFASSNSYDGFVSYFDNVFSSRDFTKIFVLKGGPGTGKSTLMKRVACYGESQGFYTEAIYCSSDSKSLDGIIIKSDKGSIAIIDGTAPHERDAIIPGAVDELVWLGEGWRSSELEEQRGRIFDINSKKTANYKKAYENLHLSSIFARNIRADIAKYLDFKKIDHSVNMLCRDIYCEGKSKKSIRLISSFSKEGATKLPTLYDISEKVYTVSGKYGSCEIYLSLLLAALQKTDMNYTVFPTALDKNIYDAIYLNDTKTVIMTAESDDAYINTMEYMNKDALHGEMNNLINNTRIKNYFMEKARDCLAKASEFHFELESIYTPSMDFLLLDEYTDKIIDRCLSIL